MYSVAVDYFDRSSLFAGLRRKLSDVTKLKVSSVSELDIRNGSLWRNLLCQYAFVDDLATIAGNFPSLNAVGLAAF